MNNIERIKEVFSDKEFIAQVFELETPEQVQELLREKDIDLTIEDIVDAKEYIEKHLNGESDVEELTDKDLEDVSGGAVCLGLLIGGLMLAAIGVGSAVVGGGVAAGAVVLTSRKTRGRW